MCLEDTPPKFTENSRRYTIKVLILTKSNCLEQSSMMGHSQILGYLDYWVRRKFKEGEQRFFRNEERELGSFIFKKEGTC